MKSGHLSPSKLCCIALIVLTIILDTKTKEVSKTGVPYNGEGKDEGRHAITEKENLYFTKAMICVQKGQQIPEEIHQFIASSPRLSKMLRTLHLKNLEKSKDFNQRKLRAIRHALNFPARPAKVYALNNEEGRDDI